MYISTFGSFFHGECNVNVPCMDPVGHVFFFIKKLRPPQKIATIFVCKACLLICSISVSWVEIPKSIYELSQKMGCILWGVFFFSFLNVS